jgi:hypothetical protein
MQKPKWHGGEADMTSGVFAAGDFESIMFAGSIKAPSPCAVPDIVLTFSVVASILEIGAVKLQRRLWVLYLPERV